MFLRILVIFSLFMSFAFSQKAVVRVGKYPEKERIVLQLDKSVNYKVYTLENPKRVVVDIMEDVNINLPANMQGRIGKHHWGTRLVFERNFQDIKAFSLQEPFRIVIDVYTGTYIERAVAKVEERDELIEIIDPVFVRILRHTNMAPSGERVVNEVRRGQVITQRRVVVIDPGHGGHDPGAIGFMQIKEKDVVLAIAKRITDYLEKDGRFKVIMTRKDDTFVPLQERANIALRNRADLFISIHADAHPQRSPEARGTTIFAISSEAAQRRRQQIVSNQNYASLVFGRDDIPTSARAVLADLAMDVTLNESVVFGNRIAKVVRRELGRDVHFRGIQRAGFAVLKTPGIPSVLVEVGFMTNPQEALMMSDKDFQDSFARALYLAIVEYFFPTTQKLTSAQETYAPAELP
ncbi:N-acetylmuramoyl-L-alanine amidase [Pampinifervens florentissimum]|uniref:N-acetylmuramoyl-L-alanine amidase n=1 Tax=Pampinifervens florentissimum TaxID=1632019 RepID=UPI0013B48680|nr:N-acetylmuramoyl-L-alanine amidase [Hydrogenobacter sp. T-8]QID33228.1 N-acetylmuramoyl-L-alanine amidase [Hydrogenobacter sp. T-8]